MQSLLWPEIPGLFTSNFGVAAFGIAVLAYLLLLRMCHQEIVLGKAWSIAQLQHTFRLRVITNQVEHNLKARLTKARKAA